MPRRDTGRDADPYGADDFLAKVDAAVAGIPDPQSEFTPRVDVAPEVSEDDVSVRQAAALSDSDRKLLRDSLAELLPLAVRLVRLSMDRTKGAHLHAALDALGFEKVLPPGEKYTGPDPVNEGKDREYEVRQGQVYVPEDRQKVLESLAAAL